MLHEEPLSSWLIREEFARVWRVFIDTRARGTIHYKGSLSKAPCVLVVWTLFPKANVSVFELSRTQKQAAFCTMKKELAE